ncbi:protein of unknown function [Cyanobium sp. NIES-981]|nr:protein of unknown function [Cyanobium sp. NIES-981]
MSAIGMECFMKQDSALWNGPIKGKSQEHILGNAFVDESFNIPEAKPTIVLRIPDQAAAFRFELLQA